jgi:PadR family transcriptional regulator, regulatory protein PadR
MTVLSALAADPARWRYGYELGAQTGLKAGSLYPILVRLAERGFLDAAWEESPTYGRPARHLYRLTQKGQGLATATDPAAIPAPAILPARATRTRSRIAEPGGA